MRASCNHVVVEAFIVSIPICQSTTTGSQIEFTEWTPDGHLRHSKFVGLREDKDARDVVREE
jgi:ATP-dependent DNA ligase